MLTTTLWLSLLIAPTQFADTDTKDNEYVHIVPPRGVYAEIDTTREIAAITTLRTGSDKEKAETAAAVLQNSERYAPVVFFALATYLFQQDHADDALFWMYAGRIRTWYDIRRCSDNSVADAITLLNDQLPELLRLSQFEDLDKTKSVVEQAVEWDRQTAYNYDPRWIALHGIRSFTPVPEEGHEIPLTIPEDQWAKLAEEHRTEYLKTNVEDMNSFTPEMMEQIRDKIAALRGTGEMTQNESAAESESAADDGETQADIEEDAAEDEAGDEEAEAAAFGLLSRYFDRNPTL